MGMDDGARLGGKDGEDMLVSEWYRVMKAGYWTKC